MPNNLEIGLMLKVCNTHTQGTKIRDNVSLDSLIRDYSQLLHYVKFSSYNVFTALRQSFPDYEHFFKHLLSASKRGIITLRSCVRFILKEIIMPRQRLCKLPLTGSIKVVPLRIMTLPETANTNTNKGIETTVNV